jgi:glycolate oxidase FAD binding subunit
MSDTVEAVAPATTEEVAATLRLAQQNRWPVTALGGGTKQKWGYAVEPKLLLEMRSLDQVREHTWQDMTCSVEAGCCWSALQAQLAQHGQRVALDPLWPDRATVGGIVATNDSGALRLRYGALRDLIIGMTIVLADGTIAHTGGKVVKNVAGYDLHKLMTGAFGTLGIVTSVNFRLHSLPQCERTFSIYADRAEPLGKRMLELLHAQLCTQATQLRSTPNGFALDIQLASLTEVVASQAALLQADASEDQVWNARQRLFDLSFVCKATMLPTEIARFAELVRAQGGESVTQAVGVMIAGLPSAAGVAQLRAEIERARGSLMVLQQPADASVDCWGTAPDSLPLMREIKRRFDPDSILNHGKFLGHI